MSEKNVIIIWLSLSNLKNESLVFKKEFKSSNVIAMKDLDLLNLLILWNHVCIKDLKIIITIFFHTVAQNKFKRWAFKAKTFKSNKRKIFETTSNELVSGFFRWEQNRGFSIICFCCDLAQLYIFQINTWKVPVFIGHTKLGHRRKLIYHVFLAGWNWLGKLIIKF